MNIVVIQRVLFALVLDALTGPVWWYSAGALHAFRWYTDHAKSFWQTLGVGLWIKNLFVPMFGQFDWQGRIISFFIRLFQIVIRSIGYVLYMIVLSTLFVLWFVAPVAVVYFFSITLF